MLKLTVAVLAVALAGTANAAGWRSLRVDGSSEVGFAQSLAAFREKLSPARRSVFGQALMDIWVEGTQSAEADEREYTPAEYYLQLDGLGYEEVVTLTDPTGDTARTRYRAANRTARVAPPRSPWPERPVPQSYQGQHVRGLSDSAIRTGQAACACPFPY